MPDSLKRFLQLTFLFGNTKWIEKKKRAKGTTKKRGKKK